MKRIEGVEEARLKTKDRLSFLGRVVLLKKKGRLSWQEALEKLQLRKCECCGSECPLAVAQVFPKGEQELCLLTVGLAVGVPSVPVVAISVHE